MIAVLLALLLQAPGTSAEAGVAAGELEQVCKTVLCRTPAPVRLTLPGGKKFEMTLPRLVPIVSGGFVTILAGEKVFVEAEAKDARLTNLVAVPKVTHPERTLVFDLKQEPLAKDGTDMILTIESPFPDILKYRLGMMLVTDEHLRRTSSCPLEQGKPVFEHWPHPIFQLVAGDFRFVEPSSENATLCE